LQIVIIFNSYVFYRFDEKENISGFQQLKTSVQKGIRSKILEQYPYIENCINDVLPKKEPFRLMKWFVGIF
jgi:PUA domain protein